MTTGPYLTRRFHCDLASLLCRCARHSEDAALGRRLRRGQQCYSGVINALRAWNEISLARVLAHSFTNLIAVSLDGKVQVLNLDKHRQGLDELVNA